MILVRREGKTVISMANDYRGPLNEFALVVPVPQVLERGQIQIGDRRLFERIDAYSAPRLAEYHDPDPCAANVRPHDGRRRPRQLPASVAKESAKREKALGVTVEARLHGRRVRHRDAVREGVRRPRDVAPRERLPDTDAGERRAAALCATEHEVLRREGQPLASRRRRASPTCGRCSSRSSRRSSCCRSGSGC